MQAFEDNQKTLDKLKIKEKGVAKDLNPDLISALTVEVLLRYLQLDKDLKPKDVLEKLNWLRKGNTKVLPDKLQKMNKPESKQMS